MAIEEPKKFNFKNWDTFCSDALRYHELTRPNDRLVAHRIDTFRKFMSKTAAVYLSGLLRPHPRYETDNGWDQWVHAVTEMLSIYEIARPFQGKSVKMDNVHDIVEKYTEQKSSVRRFWQGLDELVSDGKLASSEQRDNFWYNLRDEDQKWLARQCAYFDPSNAVWEKDSVESAKTAEQAVSQTAELLVVDDVLQKRLHSRWLKALFICCILNDITQLVVVYSLYELKYGPRFLILMIVLNLISIVCHVLMMVDHKRSLKKLEAKRCELFDLGTA